MKLRDIVKARVKSLRAMFDASAAINHPGEKGSFREFFVAEVLQPLLPHQFGIGSGIVVAHNGAQSRQTDLVVFDRRLVPPIMTAGDRGMYPLDSVLAVAEVKSMLMSTNYPAVLSAARHFCVGCAECMPMSSANAGSTYPHCALFGYTSDAKRTNEDERIIQAAGDPTSASCVPLICVLDKGIWSWQAQGFYHSDAPLEDEEDAAAERTAQFVMLFLNRIEETAQSRHPFRLQEWF